MTNTLKQLKSRRVLYQTRTSPPLQYKAEFSDKARTVETLEGPVKCEVGDVIVTGVMGERWPVPGSEFLQKYYPVPGQEAGKSGHYLKHVRVVHSTRLDTPLEVELSGGRGRLQGKAGDWYVWYSPGSTSIVSHEVFVRTYELARIPVYTSIDSLSPNEHADVKLALERLRQYLPHTPLIAVDRASTDNAHTPIWFQIAPDHVRKKHSITPVLTITPVALATGNLDALLADRQRANSAWRVTFAKIAALSLFPSVDKSPAEDATQTIAAQLAAVEEFNFRLAADNPPYAASGFIDKRQPDLEPPGVARLVHIGEVADRLAVEYQAKWQSLVLATTKEIASIGNRGTLWRNIGPLILAVRSPRSLTTLGLIAAGMLAASSELAQLSGHGPLLFLAYVIALVIAWSRYATAKARRWEANHQDLRLLAEWLRALHIHAMLHPTMSMTEVLLLKQHSESGWVRLALRSLMYAQPLGSTKAGTDGAMGWVQDHFISHQIGYHEDTLIDRRKDAIETLSAAAKAGSRTFLASMLALAALNFAEAFNLHADWKVLAHVLVIFQLVALAYWGAMRKVMDLFGLEQEAQRGELVLHALREAQGKDSSADDVLRAAKAFVRDQEDWHSLRRSKPVEAATGA